MAEIKQNNSESELDSSSDSEDEKLCCEICEKEHRIYDGEIYKCDGCDTSYCYDCRLPNQYENKCTIRGCYYCRRGNCYNNGYQSEYYCESCFEPDTCSKCKSEDELLWKCDKCEKLCCYDCEKPETTHTECYTENCYHCRRGNCYNIRTLDIMCSECYEENELNNNESDDNESDDRKNSEIYKMLENRNYDDIIAIYGLNVSYKKQKKKIRETCSICMDEIVNCRINCKHMFCFSCYIIAYHIYDSKKCAICQKKTNSDVVIYKN